MYLYKVGVKYQKETETGEIKKVTEHFLISAVSFTDAEFRAAEVLPDLLKKEGEVVLMERKQFNQVIQGVDEQQFFEVKISVVVEEAKIQKGVILIKGYGMEEALDELGRILREEYASFKIVSAKESTILDFFPMPGEHEEKNLTLRTRELMDAEWEEKETAERSGVVNTSNDTKEEAQEKTEKEAVRPQKRKPATKKAAPAKKSTRASK